MANEPHDERNVDESLGVDSISDNLLGIVKKQTRRNILKSIGATVVAGGASTTGAAEHGALEAPFTEDFETGLNGWTIGLRDEWIGPRVTQGSGSWSSKHNGSVRLHVNGGPSHIGLYHDVGAIPKGTKFTITYESPNLNGSAGGPRIFLRHSDVQGEKLDQDQGGQHEGDGVLEGTASKDYPEGTSLEVRLGVWPGEITVYVKDITVSDVPSTGASLSLENTRLVQSTENSRLEPTTDESTNKIDDDVFPDALEEPPLVEGKVTAYLFDVSGSQLEELSEAVSVTISKNGSSQGMLTIPASVVRSGAKNGNALFDAMRDADENLIANVPLVTVEGGDIVSVSVDSPDIEAIGKDIEVGEAGTKSVSMPDLNVGIMAVEVPLQDLTLSYSRYKEKARSITKNLQNLYPTARVNTYIDLGIPLTGAYQGTLTHFALHSDMHQVHKYLTNITPIDSDPSTGTVYSVKNGEIVEPTAIEEFDVILAIVPKDYYNLHDSGGLLGLELVYTADSNGDGIADVQPTTAASASIDAIPETAAMEVGHHFISFQYPQEFAQEDESHHATPDLHSTTLRKNPYTLQDDDSEGLHIFPGQQSIMSDEAELPFGIDIKTYQFLIDSDFDPVPEEGSRADSVAAWVGEVGSDGLIEVLDIDEQEQGFVPTVEETTEWVIETSILSVDGETITSLGVPGEIQYLSSKGADSKERALLANIPYPDEAYKVSFTTESSDTGEKVTTGVVPVKKQLEGLPRKIPANGFKNDAEERKQALEDKIASIGGMVEKQKFRPALNKLRRDLRDKLKKWLKDDYETAPNLYTKQEAIDVVDSVITRVETYQQHSTGSGNGTGKGSGQNAGGGSGNP